MTNCQPCSLSWWSLGERGRITYTEHPNPLQMTIVLERVYTKLQASRLLNLVCGGRLGKPQAFAEAGGKLTYPPHPTQATTPRHAQPVESPKNHQHPQEFNRRRCLPFLGIGTTFVVIIIEIVIGEERPSSSSSSSSISHTLDERGDFTSGIVGHSPSPSLRAASSLRPAAALQLPRRSPPTRLE